MTESCSVVSNSLQPHGLYSPWNSPGQGTGVGSLSHLQGIFTTQGLNPGLLHCRQILYQLSHKGSPRILEWIAYPFSSEYSWPRNQTGVSCIAGRIFFFLTTELPGTESEKVGLKLNIQKTKIMASGPITSWQIYGETVSDFIFLGSKITADGDCRHEIKRRLLHGRKVMSNLDSILQSRDVTLSTKVGSSQGYGFSSGYVWMWELDYKESWVLKNWCFWTAVLEKTLESPLDFKEIQPVHPKGDESWVFTGRTDAEAETPILWPPDAKSWLICKDPDSGKDWRQEEKGMAEDEMVGWYHWLNGHKFE